MATEATLTRLRKAMQKLSPAAQGNALPLFPVASGIPALDRALLLGGLPAGRVSEIAGPMSSGKTGLAMRLLAEQTQSDKQVAIVDGTGHFYPPAAAAMGVDLPRTLLVSPNWHDLLTTYPLSRSDNQDNRSKKVTLVRIAEIIARSRAFSMVLIDLPFRCQIQHAPARRLHRAALATGTTILALSTQSGDVQGCSARIEVSPCQRLGSKARRSQFCIVKGGINLSLSVEHSCKLHRFDSHPPQATAPILFRPQPGQELKPVPSKTTAR